MKNLLNRIEMKYTTSFSVGLLAVSLLAPVNADAAYPIVRKAEKLPVTLATGTVAGAGFCAQFTKGAEGSGADFSVNTIPAALNLLDDLGGKPDRFSAAANFFAIIPRVDLHDGYNAGTSHELPYDQLFPWSTTHASQGGLTCNSPGSVSGIAANRFAARLQGDLHVRRAGVQTVAIRSDEGYEIIVGSQKVGEHVGTRVASVSSHRVEFQEAGVYPINIVYFENAGPAVLEMFIADQEVTFVDGSGEEVSPNPLIGVDVLNAALDKLPSAFKVLSYAQVSLPTGLTAGSVDCRDLVGKPTDMCVLSDPLANCGNGVVDKLSDGSAEACDDGNKLNGDGCNTTCEVEVGYTCAGTPNICFKDIDSDGIADDVDNCRTVANPGQDDADADGVGDACDLSIHVPLDGTVSKENTYVATGTGDPGSTVTITLDGTKLDDVVVGADGTWELALPELADGEHVLTVNGDVQGKAKSVKTTFEVDTTPPVLVVTSPVDGVYEQDGDKLVVRGTSEPGATIRVLIDGEEVGQTTVGADGTWTVVLDEKPKDDSYTLVVESSDSVDNKTEVTIEIGPKKEPGDGNNGGPKPGIGENEIGGGSMICSAVPIAAHVPVGSMLALALGGLFVAVRRRRRF